MQNNKQLLSSLRRKARDRDLAPYRCPSLARNVKYDLVFINCPAISWNLARYHALICYLTKNSCRVLPDPASRINARWTNEELLLAVQVFFLLMDSISCLNPTQAFTFLAIIQISCLNCSEYLLQGIRKFGKNFSVIASILGTKTESHVRSFFVNYRRRYDLDVIYKVSVGSTYKRWRPEHIEHFTGIWGRVWSLWPKWGRWQGRGRGNYPCL